MSRDSAAATHVTDPVFVLCAARSGSTLLRFMLDAHPDLACPPETNVAGLFSQLATVWTQFEVACPSADPATGPQISPPGDPVPVTGGQLPSVGQIPAPVAAPVTAPGAVPVAKPGSAEQPAVPGPVVNGPSWQEPVLDGIRRTVDDMIGSYLQRRGKKRYCDKSLNTAAFVDLLVQLYPAARFICLYRHPMDVIASGVEACPWGLSGYGFEPYAAGSPGNTVHALAHFWADNTAAIVDVAARYPNRCIQVRYEDMVTDPELVSAQIFQGLGLPGAPGVSQAAFGPGREFAGPSDFKIWQTSGVSAASLSRGWSVPAQLIGPGVRAAMNNLAARLGYLPVDDKWGTTPVSPDPRLPGTGLAPAAARPADRPAQHFPAGYRMLDTRVKAGLTRLTPEFARQWTPCSTETFVITATPPGGGGQPARWRVDLAAGTVGMVSGGAATAASLGSAAWDLVGSAETWEQVISGQVNLSVAIRRRDMRFCEFTPGGPTLSRMRIGMLADLLSMDVTPPGGAAPPPAPAPAQAPAPEEEGPAPEDQAPEEKKTRRRPATAAEPARPRPRRSRPRRKEDQAGRP